jgi:DNA-binding transcriptional MerR regulator
VADEVEYGVDDLARHAGTTVRNVRLYQERGLLPKPTRRGRSAFYGPDHLVRMKLILRLLQRGYSLVAIKDLTDAWDAKRGLGDILGLGSALGEPFAEEPIHLTEAEVLHAFPGDHDAAPWLQRSVDLGILVPEGDGYRIPSPSFLAVGAELAANGIPVDHVTDMAETIIGSTTTLAEAFVTMFLDHIWGPYAAAGQPADGLEAVIEKVDRLRPLAAQAVLAALALTMQERVDRALMTEMAGPTGPEGPATGSGT